MLAPMAEITTPALRKTVKSFSPHVIMYSEMLSAAALVHWGMCNDSLSARYEFDDPIIYQVLGDSPELMSRACELLSQNNGYAIDINMGCSAPEILSRGWGARLLQDFDKTRDIIRACRKAVPCRLSVKMRSGYQDHDAPLLLDFTRMFQDEGVDFIALHPRFAKLSFRRKADWNLVEMVRKHVSIPVIGNGDIIDPAEAVRILRSGICDGIMIGREAVKSPWIFQVCHALMSGESGTITIPVDEIYIEVLKNMQDMLPPEFHKTRAHRFCIYYSQNVAFAHDLFKKIRPLSSIEDMIPVVRDYFERNPHEAVKTYHVENGMLRMSGPGE